MEDWFHRMSNPRKIKNLLTYLLTYLLHTCTLHEKVGQFQPASNFCMPLINPTVHMVF